MQILLMVATLGLNGGRIRWLEQGPRSVERCVVRGTPVADGHPRLGDSSGSGRRGRSSPPYSREVVPRFYGEGRRGLRAPDISPRRAWDESLKVHA